jgi:glutathione S-transferase
MTLFSAPDDPWSHRTRIVIAEKAIEIEVVDVDSGKYPEDLLDLNRITRRRRSSIAISCSTTRA